MMRQLALTFHKYISLIFGFIWFLQILSGVIVVFSPEIRDVIYNRPSVALDLVALEKSLNKLNVDNLGWEPRLIYTTGKEFSRFDAYFYHKNSDVIGVRAIRIDGDGQVLADRMVKSDFLSSVANFHTMFWIDDYGYIILGISGILLCSNILLGLMLIWRNRLKWGSFFSLSMKAPMRIRLYHWHRCLGLCCLLPAFFVIFTGVLNVWLGDIKNVLGDPWPAPQVIAVDSLTERDVISLSAAVGIAFRAYPTAKLSIVTLPSSEEPYYMIRLRQKDEIRNIFGNTKLYIDAFDGKILANYDQLAAPINAKIISSLYSLHLGEFLGITGRILVLLTGLALLVLGGLGGMLWWHRRVAMKGTTS